MQVERDFDANPESARAVRRFVADSLSGTAGLDDILLTASELATNVIRHAQTRYTVRLRTDDRVLRLEVSDGSSIVPALEDLVESQRGLRIVDATSLAWGVEGNEHGKTIWADFPLRPSGTSVH